MRIDLNGKNAIVTGVSDDGGFGWTIAKSLQAAGAAVYLASHPQTVTIVERLLRRAPSAAERKLPYGVEGELAPAAVFPCDVAYDTAADLPADVKSQRGYEGDVSLAGAAARFDELSKGGSVDILIHSVAFSPDIDKDALATTRAGWLLAQSISAFSLAGLVRAFRPRLRSAAVVGLTYQASTRVVPGYGGGMASAKAALECEARSLADLIGPAGHRVNLVSAGPYPSRAARSIGAIDKMVVQAAEKSPLRRAITREEVADTTLFLCSPFASAITGEVIHVDAGYHVMAP